LKQQEIAKRGDVQGMVVRRGGSERGKMEEEEEG
jgi:hypothetical protein